MQVFGPAFRRNARWSVAQPVPEVGDDAAPWDTVERFYDFWFTFRSWREFPHPDEEEVEQAESREERRHVLGGSRHWSCMQAAPRGWHADVMRRQPTQPPGSV